MREEAFLTYDSLKRDKKGENCSAFFLKKSTEREKGGNDGPVRDKASRVSQKETAYIYL